MCPGANLCFRVWSRFTCKPEQRSSPCRLVMLQLLRVALLWLYLLLPSLLCDNLLCYFSPLLEKEVSFEFIATECPPGELCFKANGRYGNHSVLSGRGCMARKACSQTHSIRYKGSVFIMSYSCCDWPYCNSCSGVAARTFCIAAALLTAALMTPQRF